MKRKNAWVSFIIVHLSFQIKTTKASKDDILYGLTVRVKAADIDYHDYIHSLSSTHTCTYRCSPPSNRCPTFLLIWPPKTPLPVVSNSPLIQNASTVNVSDIYCHLTHKLHGMSTCHDANSQLVKKSINGGSAVQPQIFAPCLYGILS